MNEAAEKKVGDLVAAWEEKRQQGIDVRPEDLCRTNPELLPEVRKRIQSLKKVDWLNTPHATGDETVVGSSDAAVQPTHPFLSPPKRAGEIGRLGQYRVLKQLGQGGMGTVFLAEDINLERRVALKVIAGGQGGPQARQRFIREAQSAAAIEHDNIVTVYQVGQHQGVLFLAMQMLEGESLDDRLRAGKLPLPDVIRIAKDVAQGLKAAHAKGMIHRDIKPSNLWLDSRTGRTIILDFGLARQVDAGNKLTKLGEIVGTPAYLSPEQARGEKVDHRTDLFSLGTVLYQMVTGRKPFQGADTVSLLVALVEETPPAPHVVDAKLPEAVSKLIMQLLEKKADKRPADAAAIVEALSAIEKTQTQSEKPANRKPPGKGPLITPRPASNRKNQSSKALLLGGAAIAAAILLAVVVVRISTGQAQGVLTIDTVDPDVEVVVRQGGKEIAILDKKTKQEVKVPIGTYTFELKGAKNGLRLETSRFTLKSGDREVVRVTWEPRSIVQLPKTVPTPLATLHPLAAKLAGTKWVNSNKVTFEWDSTGKLFHKGVPQHYEIVDAQSLRIVFDEKHSDTLVFDKHFASFDQFNSRAPNVLPHFQGTRATTSSLTNSIGMKFNWIPPGTFMMGSPITERVRQDRRELLHKVTLSKGFYMAVYTVTQEQWQTVMGNNPSKFRASKYLPVEMVSWDDCQYFIRKLQDIDARPYRLPTEAEWEYACRAGSSTPFYTGDTISIYQANYAGNRKKTAAVGVFPPNDYGLHDMHGNVWQWCADWFSDYPSNDVVDPQGPKMGETRVMRGASWLNEPKAGRAASRQTFAPGFRHETIGFRICFDAN